MTDRPNGYNQQAMWDGPVIFSGLVASATRELELLARLLDDLHRRRT